MKIEMDLSRKIVEKLISIIEDYTDRFLFEEGYKYKEAMEVECEAMEVECEAMEVECTVVPVLERALKTDKAEVEKLIASLKTGDAQFSANDD